MLIALTETCNDLALANILVIIQNVFTTFQILVPIIAIVALVKIFTQLTINPEHKKLKGAIKNWTIALIVFFFLPFVVNLTMNLLSNVTGESFEIAECWKYARNNSSIKTHDGNGQTGSGYNDKDDIKDKTHVVK